MKYIKVVTLFTLLLSSQAQQAFSGQAFVTENRNALIASSIVLAISLKKIYDIRNWEKKYNHLEDLNYNFYTDNVALSNNNAALSATNTELSHDIAQFKITKPFKHMSASQKKRFNQNKKNN